MHPVHDETCAHRTANADSSTNMKLELLIVTPCTLCKQAEEIWEEVSRVRHHVFRTLDIAEPDGKNIMEQLGLKTIPAILVDGQLKGVGVQTLEQAYAILDNHTA